MTAVVDSCQLCPSSGRDGRALFRGRGWLVLPHPTPAAGTGQHLLLVPNDHYDDLCDAPPWLMAGMWEALRWVRAVNTLTAYGLVGRGGDRAATGALWQHAHLEIVAGDGVSTDGVRVQVSGPVA